jgi:hypothetical protein
MIGSLRLDANDRAIVQDVIVPLLKVHPGAETELWELLSLKYRRAEDDLLTAKEFAATRRVDPDTAAKWAREGRIPAARKVGREWRIPVDAEVLEAGAVMEGAGLPFSSDQRPRRRRTRSSAAQAMRSQARVGRASEPKPIFKEQRHERAA